MSKVNMWLTGFVLSVLFVLFGALFIIKPLIYVGLIALVTLVIVLIYGITPRW